MMKPVTYKKVSVDALNEFGEALKKFEGSVPSADKLEDTEKLYPFSVNQVKFSHTYFVDRLHRIIIDYHKFLDDAFESVD